MSVKGATEDNWPKQNKLKQNTPLDPVASDWEVNPQELLGILIFNS